MCNGLVHNLGALQRHQKFQAVSAHSGAGRFFFSGDH